MQHKNMKRTHRARAFRLICCCIACALLVGAVLSAAADPQDKTSKAKQPLATTEKMDESKVIEARYVRTDFAVNDFDNPAWQQAQPVKIERYWSGASAPVERQAEARLLWTDAALYVRFVARQGEPLVVSAKPQFDRKTMGLWDRDVCELFVAPNANEPERYFEFEVAPTGEWLDARLHQLPDRRESDFDYHSGATFAARTAKDAVTLMMRVPWAALGGAPQTDARWRANLYRCVGQDPTRGYLAWQPTLAPQPNFHVPQRFGWLHFKR
ncbi:MAG TPA: carbohydrate-binding family 9-like protein [Pyrinomonadaceae bacterium]|nr:carbohydrate-binding family 9-like protein [Pyrinomonadaceae bacterium]